MSNLITADAVHIHAFGNFLFGNSELESQTPRLLYKATEGFEVPSTHFVNPLETEFLLNTIYKFSSYLTGNTLRLHYKAQPVNTV
jgi:hypothetical protein